ncbi:MAG TPA: ABC transporter permease [Candidatus Dormibacteraeota bacterium]|nr:ABC transporter permease [Candidatus Dormibacteraeota bacterium]
MTWTEWLIHLIDNPLVVKDGVSRMRSWRAPFIITLYLGLLGLFGYAFFVLAAIYPQGQRVGAAQVGASTFTALALIQLSLVSLFAPALAAGAISGERERRTLDVLLVSRVTPLGIVWGKLVASVAFMLLLILAALPLFAAVFLFGGIDFQQFVVTQLLTVTTALAMASTSLFCSALFRRTLTSTVVAYGVAFFGLVGTLVGGVMLTVAAYVRTGNLVASPDAHPLLFANPFYAVNQLINEPSGSPMHIGRLLQLMFALGGPPVQVGPTVEPWQATILVQLVIIALSLFGAVQLLQGWRPLVPRREDAEPEPAEPPELVEGSRA